MPNPPEFDISAWLNALGLGQYAAAFAENQISLGTLPELTDADLRECGVVSIGHRKQILAAIRELTAKMRSLAAAGEAVPEAVEDTPKTLGHFELLEPIGRGGIGRVFRAWDSTLERQVALKLLDRRLAATDPQFVHDFIREAKSAAGVSHPHSVQIYFAGEDKGEYYIAMELFEGQSMAERIARGPMEEKMVLRIAKQIVEALAATNARRLIHGDIKPHNIFITANGDAKLLDFGLARKGSAGTNADGSITGSAYYISPERARAQAEDFRSDIYSLGATLFEALTGLPPFEAESVVDLVTKRLDADAPRLRSVKPNASPALDLLIARMLAREPGDRPPSYDALLADLAAVEHAPLAALPLPKQAAPAVPVPRPAVVAVKPPAENVGGVPPLAEAKLPKRTLRRMLGDKRFLAISIGAHVLFIAVAAFLVVQTITAKRKLTFTSAPPSPNPSQRALEHQVHMAKKQNTMSAPAQPKRITTTGLAKVALPDMPSMPTSDLTPSKMAGMSGAGFGLGAAGSTGGKGGGGGPVPFFGLRNSGAGLEGTFYDFKRKSKDQPVDGHAPEFAKVVKSFASGDWGPKHFKQFTSPVKLYAKTFIFPAISDTDAGKAFQSPETGPGNWIAHYKGTFISPVSGSYRLIGFGDNLLMTKIDGNLVLDASDHGYIQKNHELAGGVRFPKKPGNTPIFFGNWFTLAKGHSTPVEIIVGDEGGIFCAGLFIQEQGVEFKQGANGMPILPLFVAGALGDDETTALKKFLPDAAFTGPVFTQQKGIFDR